MMRPIVHELEMATTKVELLELGDVFAMNLKNKARQAIGMGRTDEGLPTGLRFTDDSVSWDMEHCIGVKEPSHCEAAQLLAQEGSTFHKIWSYIEWTRFNPNPIVVPKWISSNRTVQRCQQQQQHARNHARQTLHAENQEHSRCMLMSRV
ncbi:hypothetical protein GOBAR_DD09707 [Gossypium barbadense]|nr:hypothetical protein GOBAR_DD09707 [Gossypium barbadense]